MESSEILVFLNITQAVIAFAMAAVAAQMGGNRLRMSRRILATSFAALGAFQALSMLSFWLAGQGPQWILTRTLVSAASQSASIIHLVFLALALYLTVLRQGLRPGTFRLSIAAALVVGVALAWPGAFDVGSAELRTTLRVGVRSLITTLAYAALVVLMARHRPDSGRTLGQGLVVGSLSILAASNGVNTVTTLVHDWQAWGADVTVWLQLFGLVGVMALAIAMLVWVQERTQAMAEAKTLTAERMAHFDEDTGLPNRHGFLRRIDQGAAGGAPLTLMTVHLQRYPMLERTLGSAWAREALQRVGEALVAGRSYHFLAIGRIDSDRLAIAITADGSLADADVLARRREVESVAQGLGHPVGVSFGYAVRQQRESVEGLLACACLAQEKAEAAGMHMLRFEPEQARSDADEVEIVGALYRAIGEDQLFLEYQGIFDVATGHLDGVEALIRWKHPVQGVLPPGRFLPAAERGGLMGDIDRWVLDRVCRHLRERQQAGLPDVPVAMNLSAASVLDSGLPAAVEAQLRRNRLPPALLELEITESAAMHDLARARDIVDALRALGVRIALDDLGTGYSSLSHLRELRADRLKIDRCFIGSGDRFGNAIAAAIGVLGRSLGLDVVAEGVETPEQFAFCQAQGFAKVQGWLFHRPAVRWPDGQHIAPAAQGAPREGGSTPV
jgi:EAL domain-containing protein (putative c-di-GMP-specific phosphodiesterase class I)/GGDEF domain-containing protein